MPPVYDELLRGCLSRSPADRPTLDEVRQVLDQILVSNSVLQRSPAYDVVHVNAEFAVQASDHDPSIMVVRLDDD